MIFDHIKNKDNYREFKSLYKALNFLDTLYKGEFLEKGEILIPNELFCNPVSFTTKPEGECKFEAHRVYSDLHYIVEGVERIATADITTLDVDTEYNEDKDIGFYFGNADGYYDLKPGQFMVCFPNDAHKPGVAVKNPENVKKIVFKIKVE